MSNWVLPSHAASWDSSCNRKACAGIKRKRTLPSDLTPVCAKKGAIIRLYKAPPPQTHVLCVDEMGPVTAKTSCGRRWSIFRQRPSQEADYGRRAKTWVFGALEPATGQVLTMTADQRTTTHFICFLDQVVQQWPEGDLIIILDNLSIHKTLDGRLWLLAHERVRFLFQPTYAPWLNLLA